jgi:hypothetical protein
MPHNSSRLTFSSAKTVVAAISSRPLAIRVASLPESGSRDAASSAWIAWAAFGPVKPWIWAMISPRAASSPKK